MKKMTKSVFCCVALATLSLGAVEWGQAPNGEFWNGFSTRFIFAPAFGFKVVDGAVKYVYEVTDDWHRVHTFEAQIPNAALEPVWADLPVGYVTVVCRGVSADGMVKGEAGRRTFWKKSAFDDSYPPAERTFALAYMRVMDAYFGMDQTKYLVRHGRPDPDYYLSGYPSKMLSAQIEALVLYAKKLSGNHLSVRDRYLGVAKAAADYLIAESVPEDQPLSSFTRTYANGGEYGRFVGQEDRIMLIYPAQCGCAFVALYEATKEAKYLSAAERIAATYVKLQGEDGTWFLLQNAKTGKEYATNRLQPQRVIGFFEALFRVTGNPAYRKTADRAFAFVEKGAMRDWNWEGQFEDIRPAEERWSNLTKHAACETATYLLGRFPGDALRLAQAEELVRFSEDQFVDWTPPYGNRADPNGLDDGSWTYFCRPYSKWMTPCALEQYRCYYPIDASAARFINTYLALWRTTKKAEYLAKARALGASATRMQESDGFINTWWIRGVERNDDRYHTWVNCMLATARALDNLAEAEREIRSNSQPDRNLASPKVSVFTFAIDDVAKERGVSFEEAARLLREAGVSGFDCSYDDRRLDEYLMTGLLPANLYGHMKFFSDDGGVARAQAFVDTAVRVGCPRIMLLSDDFTNGEPNEAEFAKIVAGVKMLVAKGRAKGVTVMVETFGNRKNCCSYAKYVIRLLDDVPDLCFAADTGNLYYAGRGDDIMPVVKHAGARIAHVHFKDFDAKCPVEDVRRLLPICTIGQGAVPNEDVTRYVKSIGYDGWYTLEHPVRGDTLGDVRRQIATIRSWLGTER